MHDHGPAGEQGTGIPKTIDQWERALVRHFLMVGPDGDSSDIRALEVSARTLCDACGVSPDMEDEVVAAFRRAVTGDRSLHKILRDGPVRNPTREVPNFFVHLALTLFIDIQLDASNEGRNEFRHKLSEWCGTGYHFMTLRGVENMWLELVRWLDQRVSEGLPFRRLVLPARPPTWNHIGYTRRLSFPSRSDLREVEHVLGSSRSLADISPRVVLDAFAPQLNAGKLSDGLSGELKDFRRSYLENGRRSLADHGFWRLVTRVLAGMFHGSDNEVLLEMTFNENGGRSYRVRLADQETWQWHDNLAAVLHLPRVQKSSNLGAAVRRGALVFRPAGMGRWQAERDLTRCRTKVHVAFKQQHFDLIGHQLGRLEPSTSWFLTREPVPVDKAESAFRSARISAAAREVLFSPAIVDGIRVKEAWLGLPRFLPAIESDAREVKVFPDPGASVRVKTDPGDGVALLKADAPVTGVYNIEPELVGGESRPPWRRRLQFVSRASPHVDLSGALMRLPILDEWVSVDPVPIKCRLPELIGWNSADERMEYLLEAVYASGKTGWDEQDLVALVRRAGDDVQASPWRTMRMLQDGGVIEPRLRQAWKGRSWVLSRPRILAADSDCGPIALLEGASCIYMLEDFRSAVRGLGGQAFRFSAEGIWSVSVIGSVRVSPLALAERLGWEFVENGAGALQSPLALVRTTRAAEDYTVGSTWCWLLRRFVSGGAVQGEVRLTRLTHLGDRDHDVYRVEHRGSRHHYLSRYAAIVAAHAAAGVPMFHFDGERIVVTAGEGALPDMLAAELRRRALRAATIVEDSYSYCASDEDARWLLSLLPGCVDGVLQTRREQPWDVVAAVRRSGGALRALWRDGQLTRS